METKKFFSNIKQGILSFLQKTNTKRIILLVLSLGLIVFWFSFLNYKCFENTPQIHWGNIPVVMVWPMVSIFLLGVLTILIPLGDSKRGHQRNGFLLCLFYASVLLFATPLIQTWWLFIIFAIGVAVIMLSSFEYLMNKIFNAGKCYTDDIISISFFGSLVIFALFVFLLWIVPPATLEQLEEAHKTGQRYTASEDAKPIGDRKYMISLTNGGYVVTTSDEGQKTKKGDRLLITFDDKQDYPLSKGFDNLEITLCE